MNFRSLLLSRSKRSRVRLAFAASIAATGWLATPGTSTAGPSYSLACAKRDLELVALIEMQGDTQAVAAATLANAYQDVIRARDACDGGRVEEGLAIYDQTFTFLLRAANEDDE